MTETIGIVVSIFISVFAIELAFRKNRKEYVKAEKDRDVMVERQMESLAVLKDIKKTLQEISQKLDKK